MKSLYIMALIRADGVAPLAGAWIEIRFSRALRILSRVAPLAGAWIEINQLRPAEQRDRVAPLAGGVD